MKSHLALFAVNLLYGINYLVAKGLMPGVIGANGFIFLRVTGATLLFWILLSFRYEKIKPGDVLRIILCGIFGVGINQLLFFNGLSLTSPVNASVIMVTTPILVLLLSLIFVKEKVNLTQIIGVLLGGLSAIIFSMQNAEGTSATTLGDLLIMLNAASYAIYLIMVKPLMAKYNALTVITWVFTFGLVVVLIWPPAWNELPHVAWQDMSTTTLAKIIFVVAGVTFLPYLLMVYAMKKVNATVAAVYIYIQPVLATIFVFMYASLGLENYTADINMIKLLCTLFIFIGVYLVIRPQKVRA